MVQATRDYMVERKIKKVLRRLSKQRVALILNPGGVWVIERAVEIDEETEPLLRTCELRGWIELIDNEMPNGKLPKDGNFAGNPFTSVSPFYKLTDAGWRVINNELRLLLVSVLISILALICAILSIPIVQSALNSTG